MRGKWFVTLGVLLAMALVMAAGCAREPVAYAPVGILPVEDAQKAEEEARLREQALAEERLAREREHAHLAKAAEEITANMIHFAFDCFVLCPDARATLQRTAKKLKATPEINLLIEGHCDERGTSEYNLALGVRRAQAVYEFLVLLGVGPNRLQIVSYGEERPLNRASNETAWAQNRRAQFRLLHI